MRLLVRFGNGFLRGRFADTAIRPPPCHQSAPIAGRGCHAAEWNPRGVTLVETGPISASDGFCGVAPTHRSKCGWTKCGIRLSKKRAFECTLETQPPNGLRAHKNPSWKTWHMVAKWAQIRLETGFGSPNTTRFGPRPLERGPRAPWQAWSKADGRIRMCAARRTAVAGIGPFPTALSQTVLSQTVLSKRPFLKRPFPNGPFSNGPFQPALSNGPPSFERRPNAPFQRSRAPGWPTRPRPSRPSRAASWDVWRALQI